jgi:hypothetical protein
MRRRLGADVTVSANVLADYMASFDPRIVALGAASAAAHVGNRDKA